MRISTYDLHVGIRAMCDGTAHLPEELARSLRFVDTAENLQPKARTSDINWLATIETVETFATRHGHLPRHCEGKTRALKEQGRLADWLSTQRTNQRLERLCFYQQRRLEALRGFRWEPRSEEWHERLDSCAAFLAVHGRLPRIRSAVREERGLARWIYAQRTRERHGRLTTEEKEAFEPFAASGC